MRKIGSMRFGLLAPTLVKDGLLKFVDDSMIDVFWTGDMPQFNNPYVNLVRLATDTKRVKLGYGCANPYTCNPFVTASGVCRLNELANGRLTLALGAGSLDVLTSVNLSWQKPVQRCKEAIEIIRALSSGETVSYEGRIFRFLNVRLFDVDLKWRIQLFLGCRGPNMLTMAGGSADGVLMDDVPVEYIDYAKKRVKEGAAKTGRSLEGFQFCNLVPFSVSRDRREARELVKKFIAIDLITVPERVLDLVGITAGDVERIKVSYPDLNEAAKFVTDRMIDEFSISGTLDECIEHTGRFFKKGVNEIALAIPRGANVKEMIEVLDKEIIPRFPNVDQSKNSLTRSAQ